MKDILPLMLTIVIVLALHRSEVQSEDNPGLEFLVSQHGLDVAAYMAVDKLCDEVLTMKIPDAGEYIRNMYVMNVTKPTPNVTLNSHVLTVALTNAGLTGGGDWSYNTKLGLFTLSDAGTFTCSASNASISLSVEFGIDAVGHPTISTTGCRCSISSLSANLSGGASFIYNLLIKVFNGPIRKLLEGKICDAATKVINGKVNEQMTSLPLEMPVAKHYNKIMIDYRCLSAPSLENGCLVTKHRAMFYSKDHPNDSSIVAADPFPNMTTTDKMVTICISDYVPNTMCHAVYTQNILTYTLRKSDLPAEFSGFLSTACASDSYCMGNLYPELPKMYPTGSVEVTIEASKAPTTNISSSQIQVTFYGIIICRAAFPDGGSADFLTLNIVLKFSFAVGMDQNLVKVNVTSIIPTVEVVSSSVGSIPDADMTKAFETLCSALLVPMLNRKGEEGIPIPAIKDTKFSSTAVQLKDHCVCIAADVADNARSN